jgi:hypothetical protein
MSSALLVLLSGRTPTIELLPVATHSLPNGGTTQLHRALLAFVASHDG